MSVHGVSALPVKPRRRLRGVALVSAVVTVAGFAVAVQSVPAFAVTSNPTPYAGVRNGATRLPFWISGTSSLSVDVGTGNALFTDQLLTLPGRRAEVPITLTYNSSTSSSYAMARSWAGSGWGISGFEERLVGNADGSATFYGPQGLSGVFTRSGTAFISPPQFKATLAGSSSAGYTIIFHASQERLTFDANGWLTMDTDRDGNAISYGHDAMGGPSSITSSRGPVADRTVTVTTINGRITRLTQTSGSLTRTVQLQYSNGGHLTAVIDAAGSATKFSSPAGTDTGQVVGISNPSQASTTLSYTSGKVTAVTQSNPLIDGGSGDETTRLSYPSSTQTLVADPTTDQSQDVSAVPHTTYTLDSATYLVTSAQDPVGNTRSASYTPLGDVASSTNAAGGTTTFSYPGTLNGGESLSTLVTPGGATESISYGTSGANAYLPTSPTDDASNATYYGYDSSGNQTSTAQASGPQATVAYNGDGTPASSAVPGAAAGVVTSYAYDGYGDLTTITPPANSSLGARSYTWDGFGRLASATDGKGDTISYGYDKMDRITSVAYSDGTHSLAYTYDKNGRVTQRVDGSGTTSYTYDDLGHLLTVNNSANGNLISYTYDLAGAPALVTDGLGKTRYSYDSAHELTHMYPPGGGAPTVFATSNGGRSDVWLQSNSAHTTWAAHEHFSYDSTGRLTAVLGENGPATAPTMVENETLCYAAGTAPQSCTGTPATADRSNLQSSYESVSGETHTYTYDDHNRLTQDVVTGGANPRTYTYGYDRAGNRTSSTVTGTNPSSQSLTYNAGNQISSTGYAYDGAGNLTTSPARTATYNAAGQQTSTTVADATSSYTYAGTNTDELLTETVPGDHTYTYTYGRPDQNGLPEIDSVSVDGIGTGYVLSDPSGQPIMLATSSGTTSLYIHDGTGNPVFLTTGSTALAFSYDAYGRATTTGGGSAAASENPYTYGDGTRDRATGETKFGQRFYNPSTGTWTQQDTLNTPLDPTNANRYQYTADNPINLTDPTGSDGMGCAGGLMQVLGGGVMVGIGIGTAVASGGVSLPESGVAVAGGIGLAGSGLGQVSNSCTFTSSRSSGASSITVPLPPPTPDPQLQNKLRAAQSSHN
jgi:RHS repeat-associated protein